MCAIAGGLLHYFLLVTFFMMAAEAVNLYTKLVIVMGVPDIIKNRYVLKAALISWCKYHGISCAAQLISANHAIIFQLFHYLL